MAADRKAYLGSPWSNFNDFGVYSRAFKVFELIALVFKLIAHQGHSQKVVIKVKFEENVSSKGFVLSDTNFIFINDICNP